MEVAESKFQQFFTYLEIFLFLLIGFTPLFPQYINVVLAIILIIFNFRYTKNVKIIKLLYLIGVTIFFSISILRDLIQYNTVSPLDFYFIITFFIGFIFSERYDFKTFFFKLEKIIFVLACVSLIGVFMYTFFSSYVKLFPTYTYYNTTHITSYFHNFLLVEGNILKRNTGIAWEPGAFQFILNLGLFSYLKYNHEYKYSHILIYLISVVTTLSSTGLIILSLILLKFFWKNRKLRYLILCLLLFLFPVLQQILEKQISNKFNDANLFIRFDPLKTAFHEGVKEIIGIGNIAFERYYILNFQYPWDSYGQMFIRYGYILIFIVGTRLIKILRVDTSLFFILFLTFLTENIWFFPIVTILYFYSFDMLKNKGERQ